jgi:hypothetical protein
MRMHNNAANTYNKNTNHQLLNNQFVIYHKQQQETITH